MTDVEIRTCLVKIRDHLAKADKLAREIEADLVPFQGQARAIQHVRTCLSSAVRARVALEAAQVFFEAARIGERPEGGGL